MMYVMLSMYIFTLPLFIRFMLWNMLNFVTHFTQDFVCIISKFDHNFVLLLWNYYHQGHVKIFVVIKQSQPMLTAKHNFHQFWILIEKSLEKRVQGVNMIFIWHYNKITCVSWHLKSPATWLFVQECVKVNIRENIITPYYHPFVRECISDVWFSLQVKVPVIWKAFSCEDVIMTVFDIGTNNRTYVFLVNYMFACGTMTTSRTADIFTVCYKVMPQSIW